MTSSNTPENNTTDSGAAAISGPPPSQLALSRLANIRTDAATAELLQALSEIGIDGVLLKGAALADWYPDGQPQYADGDIWVAPDAIAAAERVLAAHGFEPELDERGLPGWWLAHASEWRRARDTTAVDLHRYLQGFSAPPRMVWERLRARAEPFPLAGRPALRLDLGARALYVTLHATHHGHGHVGASRHLSVALDTLDERTWREAAQLARELGALDGFAAGLRLTAAGSTLADDLQLPRRGSLRARLQASSSPPPALTLEELANAPTRQRLKIIGRKLFPPAGFIRHWWPPAERGPLWLALGYAYRPIWVAQQLPSAIRARAAARGRARRGR